MRARILLLKQDEISSLESQLDHVDREETRELFLGNARRDNNVDRRTLLTKLEAVLHSYGNAGKKNQKNVHCEDAKSWCRRVS